MYFDAEVDKRNLKIRKATVITKKTGMYTTRDVRQWGVGPEAESGMRIITRDFFFYRETVWQHCTMGQRVIISVGCA